MPNVVMIIQARMGSTRLPGKVLKQVLGRPLLAFMLERVRRSKKVNQLVIATTTSTIDDPIVDLCKQEGVAVFRGSEEDVLERYAQAAKQFKADVVVRLTADCPLLDQTIIDEAINFYFESEYDYIYNRSDEGYPRGMDVEVFSMQALEKAKSATLPQEKEHVTLIMYTHPQQFRCGYLTKKFKDSNISNYRLTVDTSEDFDLISRILESLYPVAKNFTFDDIIDLLRKKPELVKINAHIQQKKV